ncbi:MAG: hypothetical protein FFODKBPE_00056 [Candidatus Argoarchaeum ethanivorans]|uniref:Uncharacterized protein n=1 Tax=Candidatus Argoarchaeum ethanivorans TaxID=2608793 RepID=A0A811T1M3_9EURY|nr:MAG: hypothetical protein FFODKBPE_00056 [Candidatus Argoarchaeum ethanivorans]
MMFGVTICNIDDARHRIHGRRKHRAHPGAAIALEIAVGSRSFDDLADASGGGKVTSLDALMILQTEGIATE